MRFETWFQERETPGTLAHAARQILKADTSYRAAEKTLRCMYFLELVIKHGGNQAKAAQSIGKERNEVHRVMRSMGIRSEDVRRFADRLQERTDGGSARA